MTENLDEATVQTTAPQQKQIKYPFNYYATEKECKSHYLKSALFNKAKRRLDGTYHLYYQSYDREHINIYAWHGY